jgi:hypothetical protein
MVGVATMKMISSTIITSAIGVTLMSAIAPPRSRPTLMAKAASATNSVAASG